MKVVLDTNIFISGIFWKGDSNKILLCWKEKQFKLVSSLELIDELVNTLNDFKIKMPDDMISAWIDLIIKNSELVKIKNELNLIKEDPADNKILETALIGGANYIITQDKHLLNLYEFKSIKIIKPKEFLVLK